MNWQFLWLLVLFHGPTGVTHEAVLFGSGYGGERVIHEIPGVVDLRAKLWPAKKPLIIG